MKTEPSLQKLLTERERKAVRNTEAQTE
jgi:hypothetical protein